MLTHQKHGLTTSLHVNVSVAGDISKPEEIFHIIEHFCLGRRRLHIFGTDNSIRPGVHLYQV